MQRRRVRSVAPNRIVCRPAGCSLHRAESATASKWQLLNYKLNVLQNVFPPHEDCFPDAGHYTCKSGGWRHKNTKAWRCGLFHQGWTRARANWPHYNHIHEAPSEEDMPTEWMLALKTTTSYQPRDSPANLLLSTWTAANSAHHLRAPCSSRSRFGTQLWAQGK